MQFATTSFAFTIAPGSAAPSVVATVPSRGAIGADPALDAIVVHFSEAMNPSRSRGRGSAAAWRSGRSRR